LREKGVEGNSEVRGGGGCTTFGFNDVIQGILNWCLYQILRRQFKIKIETSED